MALVWRSEDNFVELVLFFHRVVTGQQVPLPYEVVSQSNFFCFLRLGLTEPRLALNSQCS